LIDPWQDLRDVAKLTFEDLFAGDDRAPLYFNTAGSAQVPGPLAARLESLREWFEREGPFGRQTNAVREEILTTSRAAAARYLGVPPSEVALMSNATEATFALLNALDPSCTKTLLLGVSEHPSTAFPGEAMARRGMQVLPFALRLPGDLDPKRTIALIAATSYKTGRNITDAEVDVLEAAGIPTIFDVTQSIGLNDLPARLLKLPNCAAVFGSCHKWLHGPQGTGFLVARASHAELFPHALGGWRQIDQITDEFQLARDARRFEGGTVDFAALATLTPLFDLFGQKSFAEAMRAARTTRTEILTHALHASSRFNVVCGNPGFVVLEGTAPKGWDGAALTDHVFSDTGCDIKPFSFAECPNGAVRISLTPYGREGDILAMAGAINSFFGN